jgi:methionyl-tRNA formyltransferase
MRVVFMGTPDFSVPVLDALVAAGHEIAAVYTRAPKPAGRRGLELTPSPVHARAAALGFEVRTPKSLRPEDAAADFAALDADIAVVVAYGLILPKAVLDAPRRGCLNIHASLLPRWRGAAPIQRAIMAGDAETGVMIMQMEEGLDTGPVGATATTPIGRDETASELHDRLSAMGARLIVDALADLAAGRLAFVAQDEAGVVYAHKIEKTESRIDWTLPAQTLHDRIRGLSPFPGAWCEIDLGRGAERVKILRTALATGAGAPGTALDDALTIACGEGALRLVEVQRAGKGPMRAVDFLRGVTLPAGTRLL